jgi:DNA polymerase-4
MTEPRACLYVDADRFYFSVEALERPGLADDPRPIVISVDPRIAPRAVVTTANDAARKLGIGSALSAAIALHRAPDAVFLPPRHELYSKHSARLMELLRSESPLVQQNSIDEAALQWDHHGFERAAAVRLRERVLSELGLSISLGLATSPLVAKMASEAAKSAPDHVHVVPPGEEVAFLAPMEIRALIGVGPKAEVRLRALGIETIGQLAEQPLPELVAAFGQSYGRYLYRASRGEDDSELSDQRQSKSISVENTFTVDTRDRAALWKELQGQAEEVARRLRAEALLTSEVAIKLRYANWDTITRQMRLTSPTDDPGVLAAGAAALMRRHWDRNRPIRLLGVRAGRLQPTGELLQATLL